jgi:uridine kinase
MDNRIIAIGGEPASGKTTLVKKILKKFNLKKFKYGFVRGYYVNNIYFIGIYNKDLFSGTDKLSMAVQPHFIKFCNSIKNSVIVFEGDRLFNQSLFDKLNCKIIIITANEEIKKQRHIDRRDTQTDKFLKAKKTKIKNIKNKNAHTLVYNNNNKDLLRNIELILGLIKNA